MPFCRPEKTPVWQRADRELVVQGGNVLCLKAFWALNHRELDFLTFLKAAKASAYNVVVMGEYVAVAAILCDEAEAFVIVKPFNGAFGLFTVGGVVRLRQWEVPKIYRVTGAHP